MCIYYSYLLYIRHVGIICSDLNWCTCVLKSKQEGVLLWRRSLLSKFFFYFYFLVLFFTVHYFNRMLELFRYVQDQSKMIYMWSVILHVFPVRVIVFNATLNNISVISWRSVLLVKETGVPGENHMTCRKSLTNFIT
jgi:hypothetical protein